MKTEEGKIPRQRRLAVAAVAYGDSARESYDLFVGC